MEDCALLWNLDLLWVVGGQFLKIDSLSMEFMPQPFSALAVLIVKL